MAGSTLAKVDGRVLTAVGIQAIDNLHGAVKVQGHIRSCGAVQVLRLAGNSVEITANPVPTAEPQMSFVFVEAGSVAVREGDEPWRPLNIALVLSPDGIRRNIRFLGHWQALMIRMPRAVVNVLTPSVPKTAGLFPTTRMLDRAMRRFASELLAEGEMSESETHDVEHMLSWMAGAVVQDRLGSGWHTEDPHVTLRVRASAAIRRRCSDQTLSPAAVAHDVQVSLRTLQAVFAEVGSSVAVEIRRQRCVLARSILTDPRMDGHSIEHVAEISGFGTAMSMRRAVHDMYGVTPKTLRETRAKLDDFANNYAV